MERVQTISSEAVEDVTKLFDEQRKLSVKLADTDMKLMEFEIIYSLIVPKNEREKNAKLIQGLRDKEWKKALEKANGNEIEAISFYLA